MKYKIREKDEHLIVIDYDYGFIEIYKNGVMYTNIEFNGDIKKIRKILRIANRERIKNNIKCLFRK